jgi:predicted transcriptional regulator
MIEHFLDNAFLVLISIYSGEPICKTEIKINIENELLEWRYSIGLATIKGIEINLINNGFIEKYECTNNGNSMCYRTTLKGFTAIKETLILKERLGGGREVLASDAIRMGVEFCPTRLAILLALISLSNQSTRERDIRRFINNSSYEDFPEIKFHREWGKLVKLRLVRKEHVGSHKMYNITDDGRAIITAHESITRILLTDFFQQMQEDPWRGYRRHISDS